MYSAFLSFGSSVFGSVLRKIIRISESVLMSEPDVRQASYLTPRGVTYCVRSLP